MHIKQRLAKGLEAIENCEIISPEDGAPHILNASFVGMRGEVLLHALENKNIYVSTGSACASKNKSYSHVLQALKLNDEKKEGAIRFSFSKLTTEAMIDYTIDVLKFELDRLNTIINRR
jgi:cysteine desulfurase